MATLLIEGAPSVDPILFLILYNYGRITGTPRPLSTRDLCSHLSPLLLPTRSRTCYYVLLQSLLVSV